MKKESLRSGGSLGSLSVSYLKLADIESISCSNLRNASLFADKNLLRRCKHNLDQVIRKPYPDGKYCSGKRGNVTHGYKLRQRENVKRNCDGYLSSRQRNLRSSERATAYVSEQPEIS